MAITESSKFYTGTSGLLLPVPNKEYYPEAFKDKSRLCYYGSLFNSIEVNSSFYKVPMASTVTKWAAETPEDFRFTFKLWRDITHSKGLVFLAKDISMFMERIEGAGAKKGCLLVQFPGSIKPVHVRELEQLLMQIVLADPYRAWKVAIEFRHQSWYQSDTYDLLKSLKMGLVLHDKLVVGGAMIEQATDFVYLRFHGPGGNYRGSYDDNFLYEYASYIKEWLEDGKQVYTYFNNTMGDAIKNLETLRAYVLEE
ncbi:DUF72 domain-containing protein [Pedobacter sp.]|uniref:DUF72 domain-containing protein n=1 Tax=Pedobacter sp. TaxID=1411316 RepID=UPI003D7FB2F4